MLLFCKRGRSILYPIAPQVCFQKILLALPSIYSTVCYYTSQLIDMYKIFYEFKAINNFYANIGLVLFNNIEIHWAPKTQNLFIKNENSRVL